MTDTTQTPALDDSHTIRQLAIYSQRIDVLQNGPVDDDGKPLTSWADIGEIGQEEYLKDAERTVKIMRLLGWGRPQLPEGVAIRYVWICKGHNEESAETYNTPQGAAQALVEHEGDTHD